MVIFAVSVRSRLSLRDGGTRILSRCMLIFIGGFEFVVHVQAGFVVVIDKVFLEHVDWLDRMTNGINKTDYAMFQFCLPERN